MPILFCERKIFWFCKFARCWPANFFWKVRKSQIHKFLGTFRYRKSANFLYASVREFLWLILKSQVRKFLQKNYFTLTQNRLKSTVFLNDFLLCTNLNWSFICYICKKKKVCICSLQSPNPKRYSSPQICGFAIWGTYWRSAHLWNLHSMCSSVEILSHIFLEGKPFFRYNIVHCLVPSMVSSSFKSFMYGAMDGAFADVHEKIKVQKWGRSRFKKKFRVISCRCMSKRPRSTVWVWLSHFKPLLNDLAALPMFLHLFTCLGSSFSLSVYKQSCPSCRWSSRRKSLA